MTTNEKTTRVTVSPLPPGASVEHRTETSFARERPDVVSALRIRPRERPNSPSWTRSTQVLAGLVLALAVAHVAAIRMTAHCRLPRGNLGRREQMSIVVGDHIAQLAPRLDQRGIDPRLPS